MRTRLQRAGLGALAPLLLIVGGCASLSSEPDPTQLRIDDMDKRLGGVERVVNNQSLVQLAQRIDELNAQLRTLRGQVEELQNSQEQLRAQQRSLYADLEKRTAALEARDGMAASSAAGSGNTLNASAPAAGSSAAAAAPGPGVAAAAKAGSPEQRYGAAFDALKAANYSAAIAGFGAFLRDFPSHALADNAQYWLGEAYYVTRDYDRALAAFTKVGQLWPDSRKAPDAALKLGYTQFELKRVAAARATLAGVIGRWPGTEAARLAQDRLKRMPAAP